MEDKDYIKELFSEKLKNHEAPVNPELWSAISSSIGSTAAVGTGMSLLSKLAIGISAAAVVTLVSVIAVKQNEKPGSKPLEQQHEPNETVKTAGQDVQNTVEQQAQSIKDTEQTNATKENAAIVKQNDYQGVYEISGGDEYPISPIVNNEPTIIKQNPDPIEKPKDQSGGNPVAEKGNATSGSTTPPLVKEAYTLGQLPTGFTPNGDNTNDLFFIQSTGLIDFSLTILNGEGKKVYYTEDPNFQWDGRDASGEEVPEGEYLYFFVAKDAANNPVTKSSSLSIGRKK